MRAEVGMTVISPEKSPVAEPERLLPPPGWMLESLAALDDSELLSIVGSLSPGSERRAAACEVLVSRHGGLVRACVQRYLRGPEPAEDLMQVGYVGLVKAINNFDPAFGRSLAAYAHPCILGEIKRHFRDKRWQIHVKRSVKELVLEVRQATWQLTQELGRAPAESELARHLGVSGRDLREARQAEMAFRPSSLDAPLTGESRASRRFCSVFSAKLAALLAAALPLTAQSPDLLKQIAHPPLQHVVTFAAATPGYGPERSE